MRRRVHQLNNEIRAITRVNFAFAGREFDIRQPILTVPELCCDQLLKERMLRSGCDRNVAAVGERHQAQSILQALNGGHISRNHGDGTNIQLR